MNEPNPSTASLLKIGELAKAADVSVSTLKYYVKEGLIAPACKTGRNMAWYDPACAATVRAIRSLQRERYYPLSVIKQLLCAPDDNQRELALLDAIHKVDYRSTGEPIPHSEAVRRSRLTPAQIARLAQAGLITPSGEGRRAVYTAADLTIMQLVRRRMDAGIPFDQSVQAFGIYARALREATRAEVNAFIAGAVLTPGFTAQAGAQMIRVSDETLDAFVSVQREIYNRQFGSGSLEDLYRFQSALNQSLERVRRALLAVGLDREATLCAGALAGEATGLPRLDEAAGKYRLFSPGAGGIAGTVAGCLASREYFSALNPEDAGEAAVLLYCMKRCWLSLAPKILACGPAAEETAAAMERFVLVQIPRQATMLLSRLDTILKQTGETYEYI